MPFKIPKLRRARKEGPEEKKLDEWQRFCQDPKYFQNLPEEEIPVIQESLYEDLMRLPFELVINQKKTMNDLLKEAEELKKQEKYSKATELYRQLATLGLFRKEIREKTDPNATDVKVEDVIAYFESALKLGYPISYGTIIKYPGIAREIASDRFSAYQPKVAEKKKEVGELAQDLKK